MNNSKSDIERMSLLTNDLLDEIEEMSEHEIDYYLKEKGIDPLNEENLISNLINNEIGETAETLLDISRAALNKAKDIRKKINIPSTMSECHELFQLILSRRDVLPKEAVLQFRDGEMPSDNDIKSMLEDCMELGLISEDDIKKINNDKA